MTRKSLAVGGALVIGLVGLAFASPALADDEAYCASPYAHQNVYGNGYRYGSHGYGYVRPHGYRPYGQNRYSQPYSHNYGGQGYRPDYGGQHYSPYYGGEDYQRDYDGEPYSSHYGGQAYSSNYGNGYEYEGYGTGGVVHEDHTRTSFNPFPLPHFETRTIHHQHPY